MFSRCKLLGLLTPNQIEILKILIEFSYIDAKQAWKPRELGAFRCSHHAKTLQALTKNGLVERELIPGTERPQYLYRATAEGHQTWRGFVDLANVQVFEVIGRAADRHRAVCVKLMAA